MLLALKIALSIHCLLDARLSLELSLRVHCDVSLLSWLNPIAGSLQHNLSILHIMAFLRSLIDHLHLTLLHFLDVQRWPRICIASLIQILARLVSNHWRIGLRVQFHLRHDLPLVDIRLLTLALLTDILVFWTDDRLVKVV